MNMKHLTFGLLCCMLVLPVAAQQQTLISRTGDVHWGGFGAPVLKLTEVGGTTALLVGARGAALIVFNGRHGFAIGGGGYGLASSVRAGNLRDRDGEPLYLEMGYAGFELEYINNTDNIVHFSVSTLTGAGGITYSDRQWREDAFEYFDDADPFIVIEPGVQVMLNVTTFFRIGAGVSYRYIDDIDLNTFDDEDLGGVAGNLILKFGGF